jgi:hypothetical protein
MAAPLLRVKRPLIKSVKQERQALDQERVFGYLQWA